MLHINFTPFPLLTTERLILRPLEMNDCEDLFFLRAVDAVNKYLENFRHSSMEQTRDFITKIITGINNNESVYWVMTLKDSEKLIGTICIWNINKEEDKAETGYVLHPDLQGKGLMSEALQKVMEFGFNNMKLENMTAHVHRDNSNSIKLLKRHNFKPDEMEKISEQSPEIVFNVCRKDFRNNLS